MSLRARMATAAGVAVALAVVAVAVSAYAGTRSDLLGQVDTALHQLSTQTITQMTGGGSGPGPEPGPGPGTSGGPQRPGLPPVLRGPRPAFGAAAGTITQVLPDGSVRVPHGQQNSIPADARLEALAARGRGSFIADMRVDGTHLRVLATGIGAAGALAVALPLTDVDSTLSSQRLLLALIAAGGVALAALLGLLVARTALAPIARFTRQTEEIAARPERLEGRRVAVSGRDELARLGRTFNTTLDALGRSVQAQRNLVADASHELRTPIASLRANLQLLRDEQQLPGEDRAALREDMIDELDELTGLVGDVVELARGSKPSGALADVRLDEVVLSLVERTRRRAPELTISCEVEETLVRGAPDRISRAVANLLDNARKWSPEGGAIDVALRGGVVSVRDHGPGFHDEDIPFVFDRFHRARDARSKPGSGLGLAIVRQAAEAHGGAAQAANASGGGAVVSVSFGSPIATAPEPAPDLS